MRRIIHPAVDILALATLLVSIGCSEGSVSLGDGPDGGVGGEGGGGGGSTPAWTGYVENFHFTSGSDDVTVEVTATSPALTGHVLVGSAPELPAATDPDVGYPAGLGLDGPPAALPYEGFRFTIHDGELTADRIKFRIETRELWTGWCALQTPVLSQGADPAFYSCLPNNYTFDDMGGCLNSDGPLDCGKLQLCALQSACDCDASACTARPGVDISFDLARAGGGAHGSVTGLPGGEVHNVWLTEP